MTFKRTVYVVAAGGRIKVGIATHVEKRVKAIQSYLEEPLEVLGTIPGNFRTERHIQRVLKKFHLKGEWFKDCAESRRIALKFIEQPALVGSLPGGRQPRAGTGQPRHSFSSASGPSFVSTIEADG